MRVLVAEDDGHHEAREFLFLTGAPGLTPERLDTLVDLAATNELPDREEGAEPGTDTAPLEPLRAGLALANGDEVKVADIAIHVLEAIEAGDADRGTVAAFPTTGGAPTADPHRGYNPTSDRLIREAT